ncbi:MAG: hypothetical protein ACT4TC_22065, partial [Myxococcaceae bacterium]
AVQLSSVVPRGRPSATWENGRGLVAVETGPDEQHQLEVLDLSLSGGILSASPFLSLSDPRYELTQPSLALAETGRAVLGYTTFDPAPDRQALQVKLVSLALSSLGQGCLSNSGCRVGACAIGACTNVNDAGVLEFPDGGFGALLPDGGVLVTLEDGGMIVLLADGGFAYVNEPRLLLTTGCGCSSVDVATLSGGVLLAWLGWNLLRTRRRRR